MQNNKKKLEIKSNNRQFSFEGKEGNYIFEEERFCNYSSGNISFFALEIYYLYVYFFVGFLWNFDFTLIGIEWIYFIFRWLREFSVRQLWHSLHWKGCFLLLVFSKRVNIWAVSHESDIILLKNLPFWCGLTKSAQEVRNQAWAYYSET